MKPATRRALKGLLFAVTGLMVGFVIAGYVLLQRSLPVTDGAVTLDGLQDEVTVTFDSLGIPQIWAHNETDALFALGYQHTADRMFQMDLIRRLSQGRLSEMLGSVTLETDKQQRMIGHARLAQKAVDNLSDHNRRRLQAYADGVNAYHESCRSLPFEFRLLPIDFEPWTVYDCLTILSFQTWFSDALHNHDSFYFDLTKKLSPGRAHELLPEYPGWAPATVPEEAHAGASSSVTDEQTLFAGTNRATVPTEAGLLTVVASDVSTSSSFQRAVAATLLAGEWPSPRTSGGSNGWVVAPHRCSSGRAMLAADPHLEISRLPQYWYAVGLHVEQPSFGVLGITIPGLPFVIMGHNGAAAWSFTVGGVDESDYFEEKLDPDDSLRVLAPDGYELLEIIVDTVYVSDAPPVELLIRLSRHGPIVMEKGGELFSLKWAGYDVDFDVAVASGFALHRATSFDTFRGIVTGFGALNANYLYADSAGNIGYQLSTPLPVRNGGDGRFVRQGWSAEDDWQGYYPLSETPHARNPSRGWLASCNNLSSRTHNLPGVYAADRILRITELLESTEIATPQLMSTWQLDRRDNYFLRWKTPLVDALDSIGETQQAELVRDWDGSTTVDSKITPLMVLFLKLLKQYAFQDELGDLQSVVSRLTLDRLYHDNDSTWFDDVTTNDKVETRDDIAQQAAREAVATIGGKSWGEMHTLTMRHPMAAVPVLSGLLGLQRGHWSWGGTHGTLNKSYYRARNDTTYECLVAPSWRFVIDFADVDAATMVLPAGNSGNPMSSHFFDFNEMWRNGERWTVPFSRDKVLERAVSTLTMQPSDTVL